MCVQRGGAWGGVEEEAAFESSWRQATTFVCVKIFGGGVGGQTAVQSDICLTGKKKACIVPPPPLQPTRCGWWGVLGAGMECVGNGGGVLCCGGGGCNAVPVCMCA